MLQVKPVNLGKNVRMSFGKINEVLDMPNLIEVQKNSYRWFLEEGLKDVFNDMSAITDKALFQKQLTALEKCMEEVIGSTVAPFYRPPQGRFTEQNLHFAKEMGYKTVFWSYAYADWDNARQPDPKWAMEQILAHTHPGMVILLHPTSKTNADIMDELLSAFSPMTKKVAFTPYSARMSKICAVYSL